MRMKILSLRNVLLLLVICSGEFITASDELTLINASDDYVFFGIYERTRLSRTKWLVGPPRIIRPHNSLKIHRPEFSKVKTQRLLLVVPSVSVLEAKRLNIVPKEYISYFSESRAEATTNKLFKEQGFGLLNKGWDELLIEVKGEGKELYATEGVSGQFAQYYQ